MMFFDTRAALVKIENQGRIPASSASFASFPTGTPQKEAEEAKEAAPQGQNPKFATLLEDAVDAAIERAVIAEFDGCLSRQDAEALAIAIHGQVIVEGARLTGVPTSLDNLTFALIRRLQETQKLPPFKSPQSGSTQND